MYDPDNIPGRGPSVPGNRSFGAPPGDKPEVKADMGGWSKSSPSRWSSSSGGWFYMGAMVLVWLVLLAPLWHLVSWSFYVSQSFFGFGDSALDASGGIGMDALKSVFLIFLGLIAAMITLFTPSKQLKSPINYFATRFQVSGASYKGTTDPEARKQIIVTTAINAIVLLILSASYFFILNNIVTVNGATVDGSIFGVLLKLVTIGIFLWFTSFIVGKFEEIDGSGGQNEDKETKRNMWTIGMIIGIITVIGIGNGLWTYVETLIDGNDTLKTIKTNLGGGSTDWQIGWDSGIDIIK